MYTHQITKDLLKTLSCVEKQTGKIKEMIEEGANPEQVLHQYFSLKKQVEIAGGCQLIHLLRDELDKRIDNIGEHPHLNQVEEKELEMMEKQRNELEVDKFVKVFDRLNKLMEELNGR